MRSVRDACLQGGTTSNTVARQAARNRVYDRVRVALRAETPRLLSERSKTRSGMSFWGDRRRKTWSRTPTLSFVPSIAMI